MLKIITNTKSKLNQWYEEIIEGILNINNIPIENRYIITFYLLHY